MKISALQRPVSLVEGVCQQLASLIRGQSSADERWLPAERSLAEQLGVSRSVVREATKRLEQQGRLEVQHGSSIKIVDKLHRPLMGSLSILIPDVAERLRQLNETRLAIEPDAARLAARRTTREQLRTMREIHGELEAAPDHAAAIEADLAFHRALAEASGNLMFRLIRDSLAEIGKQTALEQHGKVLAAIEHHDAAAERAMRAHILAAGRDMDLDALKPRKTRPQARFPTVPMSNNPRPES